MTRLTMFVMTYWLTVHHPLEEGASPEDHDNGIWVPQEWASFFGDLAAGDGVAIYQTRSGPSRWLTFPDGTRRRSRYLPGCGGVIAVGHVLKVHPVPLVTRATHDDATEIAWARLATLELHPARGCVPLDQVNAILGYQPNARMRGSGGLRRISQAAFDSLAQRLSVEVP